MLLKYFAFAALAPFLLKGGASATNLRTPSSFLSEDPMHDNREAHRALLMRTSECKRMLLRKPDNVLFEIAIRRKIGKYCFIYDNTGKSGACDYYAKGRPRPGRGDGVVPNTNGSGTGCVKGGRNSFCYMNTLSFLSKKERRSMCTSNYKRNGGAQIRWALENDYCTDPGQLYTVCINRKV